MSKPGFRRALCAACIVMTSLGVCSAANAAAFATSQVFFALWAVSPFPRDAEGLPIRDAEGLPIHVPASVISVEEHAVLITQTTRRTGSGRVTQNQGGFYKTQSFPYFAYSWSVSGTSGAHGSVKHSVTIDFIVALRNTSNVHIDALLGLAYSPLPSQLAHVDNRYIQFASMSSYTPYIAIETARDPSAIEFSIDQNFLYYCDTAGGENPTGSPRSNLYDYYVNEPSAWCNWRWHETNSRDIGLGLLAPNEVTYLGGRLFLAIEATAISEPSTLALLVGAILLAGFSTGALRRSMARTCRTTNAARRAS